MLGVCWWVQTPTTGPVWFGVIIRGAPTLLTRMVCFVSLVCLQICVCFLNATLCVWAVPRMPQHTMETWAWPQWVLFILLYFLFQSPGKCPVWVCVLFLGCVAKLSSHFIYADPLYVRVGGGLSAKSLHLDIFPLEYPSSSNQLANLNMAALKKAPTLTWTEV